MPVKSVPALLLAGGLTSLTACGGGDTQNVSSPQVDDNDTGSLSLAITDAPIDSAARVVVEFSGVSIKPTNGEAIEFTFDEPRSIDLLTLQGNVSEPLLADESVATGDYEWIRLHVNAERDGVIDSYIEMNDGSQLELWVPSGSRSGLKLVNGFTVAAGANADFTIDFDLRQSVTNPQGMPEVILKPALRLVDNTTVGGITGTVDANLVSAQCADATVDDGAVYVFTGAGVTPADVQGAEGDPVATALVDFTDDAYRYEVGFLTAGDYTVTYTCDTALDDPESADDLGFAGTADVTVEADAQTTHAFTTETQL